MYNNKHIWARKIGFGFQSNQGVPSDINSWNDEQIAGTSHLMGVPSRFEMPVSWPEEYNFSLEDRLRRAYKYDYEKKKIEKSKNLNGFEKKSRIKVLRRDTEVGIYDVYRFWNSALYGDDTIAQRLTHFWANHFTVGGGGRRNFVIGDLIYRVIYGNLGASFDEMLYRVTSHISMLDYLDNNNSVGERSESARWAKQRGKVEGLNDNLARELLELHTVSSLRGYTESDIREAAKVLAGWGANVDSLIPKYKREQRRQNSSPGSLKGFIVEPYFKHRAEPGSKKVLGEKIRSGKKGLRELTNMLANDDLTARHLSQKLALHFVGEGVTDNEIMSIYKVWKESLGDLKKVHEEVVRVTALSSVKRFLWPTTWMFQAIRVSGASFMPGFYGEIERSDISWEPKHLLEEIGNSFWAKRQPDGYSDKKEDWISTEHFDRRIRIATRIALSSPSKSGEEIANLHDFSNVTKRAIDKAKTEREKFVIAVCSPDFMEV